MTIDFLMILSLSFSTLLGVPLYIHFREKMIHKDKKLAYTKKQVFKLTFINILLTLVVTLQLFGILLGILLRNSGLNIQTIFLTLSFIFTICLVFYGAGMYITAIVIEKDTSFILQKHKSFKVIQLFHGPLSHTLVYGGCLIALLELSLLDFIHPNPVHANMLILISLGLLTGIFWAASSLYNKTYVYQLKIVLWCVLILGLIGISQRIDIISFPIYSFFFNLCLAFTATIIVNSGYKFLRKSEINSRKGER